MAELADTLDLGVGSSPIWYIILLLSELYVDFTKFSIVCIIARYFVGLVDFMQYSLHRI